MKSKIRMELELMFYSKKTIIIIKLNNNEKYKKINNFIENRILKEKENINKINNNNKISGKISHVIFLSIK